MKNLYVYPRIGYYHVYRWEGAIIEEFVVDRKGRCGCGGRFSESSRCPHIQAVIDHVERGGARAGQCPEVDKPQPAIPDVCPVCGGKIAPSTPHRSREVFWDCLENTSHFWMVRGGDSVRLFLTKPHPNKLGAYYERE